MKGVSKLQLAIRIALFAFVGFLITVVWAWIVTYPTHVRLHALDPVVYRHETSMTRGHGITLKVDGRRRLFDSWRSCRTYGGWYEGVRSATMSVVWANEEDGWLKAPMIPVVSRWVRDVVLEIKDRGELFTIDSPGVEFLSPSFDLLIVETGFPFRCMWYATAHRQSQVGALSIDLPELPLTSHSSDWRLPYRVHRLGFLANVIINGAAAYLLIRIPHWVRSRSLLRRGRCPYCGYDLAGLVTCPECGQGQPPCNTIADLKAS